MTLITVIVVGTVKGTKTGLWTALLVALIILLLSNLAVLGLKVARRNAEKAVTVTEMLSAKMDTTVLGLHACKSNHF